MSVAQRRDFDRIADWVEKGSSVLDLGCSDGKLLMHLKEERQAVGYGIDISDSHILECLSNGVAVEQMDIDEGLGMFSNDQFDYIILSQTLQGIKNPVPLLKEMTRVGRKAIVSFPNFGYWKLRRQLLGGNMPVTKYLPYQWYNTPNIRYCTISDFDHLCEDHQFLISSRLYLTSGQEIRFMPNLLAELALYTLSRKVEDGT